jgi:hypothetical protein
MSKQRKPGTVPPGRIGVYDGDGNLRGHVGPKATSVTAARFTNQHGAKLGKKDGRLAWLTPADVSALGTTAGAPAQQPAESANHKSARGSVRAPGA